MRARPYPKTGACASRYTTRRRNAHGIGEYELLYPWHPWAGCLVHIHEVVEKAGREVFRCSLSGRASGRWLEIPAWMFDRAARAAWRVGAAPYVIACIGSQDPAEMGLTKNDDMIQALAADRSNQPFGKAIPPRRGLLGRRVPEHQSGESGCECG